MPDPRTDQIAREAARLIDAGRADNLSQAIRLAAESLNARGAPLPGHGRVRKHAQAMALQSLGEAAYQQKRLDVWRVAEEVMSAFEHVMPEAESAFVGRAAQGLIDAGVTVQIRLYTEAPLSFIASVLQDFGYGEPSFRTSDTRFGRLNQIQIEEDGVPITITRCPPAMFPDRTTDLFTGKSIESVGLSTLRQWLKTRDNVEE
jgi:hypothetical protein